MQLIKTFIGIETRNVGRGAAVFNGKIYLTGGYRIDGDPEGRNYRFLNEVCTFLPGDNKLTLVAPMNCNRMGHGCCSHAGSLFVCGGKDGGVSTCCEKFNLRDNKWKFVAQMNEARAGFQAVSCRKFIWAIGGWVRCGLRLNGLNSVEYYDDVADKWTLSTPMISKRYGHSAVAFREKIYVLGGINSEDGYLRTAEVFDTELEQFSVIKSMSVPRSVFSAAISEHKLYCFGSRDCKSVESSDLYTGEWKNEENMAHNRSTTAVAVYDN